MRLFRVAIAIALAISVSGCISWMSSEPATDDTPGIRYALPQPFLLVTPKSDGTMTVETVMLPDRRRTYTISQTSIFASHSFDVTLENGMLKTVTLNGDASAVAKQVVDAAGEIKKAEVDADIAAATASAEAVKAAQTKVADSKAALDKATTLKAYLEQYVSDNPADEAAKAELLKAQIAAIQAEADYLAAQNAASAMGLELDPSGFNVADGGVSAPMAFSPVLYRIDQDAAGGVTLTGVIIDGGGTAQVKTETSKAAMPPAPTPKGITLVPANALVSLPNRQLEITANQAVTYADANSAFKRIQADGSAVDYTPKPTLVTQGVKLNIVLPAGISAGDYIFSMHLSPNKDGSGGSQKDLSIKVR